MVTGLGLLPLLAWAAAGWTQDPQPVGWDAYAHNHSLAMQAGMSLQQLVPVVIQPSIGENPVATGGGGMGGGMDAATGEGVAIGGGGTQRYEELPPISCGTPAPGPLTETTDAIILGGTTAATSIRSGSAFVALFSGTTEDAEAINLSALNAVAGLTLPANDWDALVAAQYLWGVATVQTAGLYSCLNGEASRLKWVVMANQQGKAGAATPGGRPGTTVPGGGGLGVMAPALSPEDVARCQEWLRRYEAMASRVQEHFLKGEQETLIIGVGLLRVRTQDAQGAWAMRRPHLVLQSAVSALLGSGTFGATDFDSAREMVRQCIFRSRVFGVNSVRLSRDRGGRPVRYLDFLGPSAGPQVFRDSGLMETWVAEAMAAPLSFPPSAAELGYAQPPPTQQGQP